MKPALTYALLAVLVLCFFLLEIGWGRANTGLVDFFAILSGKQVKSIASLVLLEVRLPRACTAIVAGSGLALSGLMMQTYFRNALAGPSVLGVTSGATLGVSLLMLMVGGQAALFRSTGLNGNLAIAAAAFCGALFVLLLILMAARRTGDPVTLLIVGLMFGYLSGSIISVLEFGADESNLKRFVLWGLGSFKVSWNAFYIMAGCWAIGLGVIVFIARHLDPLLLGDDYAKSMGVPVSNIRPLLLISAGILAGGITAFCGPIAFLGLAVPHVARFMLGTGKHRVLIPATILCGCLLALACDLFARVPWSDESLPLNAVTSLVGAPVVLALVLRRRRLGRLM